MMKRHALALLFGTLVLFAACAPTSIIFPSPETVVSAVHPANASADSFNSLSIVTVSNPSQPRNAACPIFSTEEPIVSEVNCAFSNALATISLTGFSRHVAGISTVVPV